MSSLVGLTRKVLFMKKRIFSIFDNVRLAFKSSFSLKRQNFWNCLMGFLMEFGLLMNIFLIFNFLSLLARRKRLADIQKIRRVLVDFHIQVTVGTKQILTSAK